MVFLKRFVTFVLLAGFLSIVFAIGGLVVGGAIMGGKAAMEGKAMTREEGERLGRQAGEEFGRKYGLLVMGGGVGCAVLLSAGVSFSGVLPWCRED